MKEHEKLHRLYQKLKSSTAHPFPTEGPVRCTEKHGVYVIYSPRNKVLHVGKTSSAKEGLDQRLQNHPTNKSSFSKQYLKKQGHVLRKNYKFKYVLVSSPRQRSLLEAYVTGLLCPAHIGTGEKRMD
jgi:excinuclease UvrABC nuclease subunit